MTEPESGSNGPGRIRRRRTRRHQRNRMMRQILLLGALVVFVAGFSALALHYLSPSLFHSKTHTATPRDAEQSRERVLKINEETFTEDNRSRLLYPYSVVPGGVEDAKELKWVAEHDPVVAAHYAGFDYDHARIVRLTLAQTVYLSYRIGSHVYWTRHRVALLKGEKLITDGKITARTKCGNRVETMPQQATSSSEPPAAKFEEPLGGGDGTAAKGPPVTFQSALLNRPGAPGVGPMPPLSLYSPFGGQPWVPISPPPLPIAGVCGPGRKKTGEAEISFSETDKKKLNPCAPTSEVPEPGSWLFMATGLVGFCGLWIARRRVLRIHAQSLN